MIASLVLVTLPGCGSTEIDELNQQIVQLRQEREQAQLELREARRSAGQAQAESLAGRETAKRADEQLVELNKQLAVIQEEGSRLRSDAEAARAGNSRTKKEAARRPEIRDERGMKRTENNQLDMPSREHVVQAALKRCRVAVV